MAALTPRYSLKKPSYSEDGWDIELNSNFDIIDAALGIGSSISSGVNSITIGSVLSTNPGTNAAVYNSGTASDLILNFAIPRGAVGPQGQAGDTGSAGSGGGGTYTASSPITITNSNISLGTVPLAMGGTGGTDGASARANLGIGSLGQQDANNVNITGGTITAGTFTVDNLNIFNRINTPSLYIVKTDTDVTSYYSVVIDTNNHVINQDFAYSYGPGVVSYKLQQRFRDTTTTPYVFVNGLSGYVTNRLIFYELNNSQLSGKILAADASTAVDSPANSNNSRIANTRYVDNAVANLSGSSPSVLFAPGTVSQTNAQGAYIMWNNSVGIGETDFVNNMGGGSGGFYFYNENPNSHVRTELSHIDSSGNLYARGNIEVGNPAIAGVRVLDFHSSGMSNDYDARISIDSNNGYNGDGTGNLAINSNLLTVSSTTTNFPNTVNLIGNCYAPNRGANDNSTHIATTQYVDSAIAALNSPIHTVFQGTATITLSQGQQSGTTISINAPGVRSGIPVVWSCTDGQGVLQRGCILEINPSNNGLNISLYTINGQSSTQSVTVNLFIVQYGY